ncbi:head maturation protease, ClpP-related [Mangrovicoccus ximenensis]|uniref:head maturation protease, ClpP-related n=1 Tax=Mangrovicoccus ximenensis TaxID=1911570 RepID=UPI000D335E0A|nr:head maturation protease, ClpP-related [Mangrovicoccus ximenensis]
MAYRIDGIIGEGNCTAQAVAAHLEANPDHAEMVFNSPGGIATEGAAIKAELEMHGNVTAYVRGLAASAASLAVMGAKRIVMSESAFIMIHDPSAMTIGTAKQHRDSAETLDKMSATYAAAYASATGNSVKFISELMSAETWLNAEDALALRFIDEIEKAEPVAMAAFDPTMFRHPPEQLLRQWRAIEQKKEADSAA